MEHARLAAIGRLSAARSIVELLGRVNARVFPWEERIAVGACQAKALDECEKMGDEREKMEPAVPQGSLVRRARAAILEAVASSRGLAR